MTDNKLYFPYMCFNKETIIERLKEYGIYGYTWHCETPTENYEACGTCTPCKKHKEALKKIEENNLDMKEKHEELKEKLDEIELIKEVEHA